MLLDLLNKREKVRGLAAPHLHRMLAVAAAAAVVIYGVMTGVHAGDSHGWTVFGDLGQLLAAAIATIACGTRAKRAGAAYASAPLSHDSDESFVSDRHLRRRIAWRRLTVGVGCWTLGELAACVYEIGLRTHVPEPSVADVGFLLSYLFVISGLLAFVRTPAGALSRLRGAVEAIFMSCGFVLCSWSLVIGSVYGHGGPGGTSRK
jgi:hypothetical protein